MSRTTWHRAERRDLGELGAFLAGREEQCTGLTGRLLRDGELHIPSSVRGALWVARRDGEIAGVTLCHPSRLALPFLPPQGEGDAELAALMEGRGWTAASAIGRPGDLDRFGLLGGLGIKVSVQYRLMLLRDRPRPAVRPPGAPSLDIRIAGVSDLDALLPLQIAYEHEEVLTPVHRFDAAACRAALLRSLRGQLIFLAEAEGAIVAKAGTNARGLGHDQIGGVFTLPERRGEGIGGAVVGALLEAIAALGRRAVLFVKPENRAAVGLYRRLGFEDIGPYRADYFAV
ncbi:MAG TPA: GNAT family N-acetyltransferase [Rectinemataceae bacterium]|nr:GNAT family N-acetyltransferase [Rectinemataceae bacterium]